MSNSKNNGAAIAPNQMEVEAKIAELQKQINELQNYKDAIQPRIIHAEFNTRTGGITLTAQMQAALKTVASIIAKFFNNDCKQVLDRYDAEKGLVVGTSWTECNLPNGETPENFFKGLGLVIPAKEDRQVVLNDFIENCGETFYISYLGKLQGKLASLREPGYNSVSGLQALRDAKSYIQSCVTNTKVTQETLNGARCLDTGILLVKESEKSNDGETIETKHLNQMKELEDQQFAEMEVVEKLENEAIRKQEIKKLTVKHQKEIDALIELQTLELDNLESQENAETKQGELQQS